MNNLDVNQLLELKKQISPPANDYRSTEQFLAEFRLRQRLKRRRQLTALLALAASLMLLCGLFVYHVKEVSDGVVVVPHAEIGSAAVDRLVEVERIFGLNSGAMFVNDDLVFFERPSPASAEYHVRLQLFRKNGTKLATLEFFAAGDDYIVVKTDQVSGSIFLNRCDVRESIIELKLSLSKDGQEGSRVTEIFAFNPDKTQQVVCDGLLVRMDFSKPPQV